MTEITGKKRRRFERHLIDPLAFVLALVLGPLVFTMLTFWMLWVPVIALVMGGPVYLIAATPVLMWWLSRRAPKAGEIALLAFVVNLIACGLIWLFYQIEAPRGAADITRVYLIFGSIFAPVWGAMFALFYIRLRRPFFLQTI